MGAGQFWEVCGYLIEIKDEYSKLGKTFFLFFIGKLLVLFFIFIAGFGYAKDCPHL